MKIEISNRQDRYRIDARRLQRLSRWLMERVEAWRPGRPWEEVCVILVDDAGILPAQRACFGRQEPTDVISQAYDPIPSEPGGRTGEVVVNVQRAFAVGGANGASRELALYVAHGCQHLGGGRDDTPRARAAMRRRESAWLRDAERAGLLEGLAGDPEGAPSP